VLFRSFTLMGLGMFFGFFAYYRSGVAWGDNHIFDLMVQRTYGAMTNDVLISIPLFVLMGYVMERGALVDKMFYSIQLAFRHVPASLAVATLIVCTFWGIASGLVGAVVVLMGVIAFNPMLKAGYDVKLASGVITAGGTLGILIPPSVMIIVYAAVAGQSVVKLYAAAMFPGFLLAFLYLLYVVVWAVLNPRIAPKLPESKIRVPVRPWIIKLQQTYSRKMLPALVAAVLVPTRVVNVTVEGARISYLTLLKSLGHALVPLALTLLTLGITWWYVVIHQQPDIQSPATAATELQGTLGAAQTLGADAQPTEENLEELGGGVRSRDLARTSEAEALQQMGSPELRNRSTAAPAESSPAREFYIYFASVAGICCLLLAYYYWIMEAEQFEVLRLLVTSVMPLAILTVVVLAVILFGITTATESAAIGAAGAFLLAYQARTLDWERTKEAVFLTAKTTSMVCWLFVGSALFSAVFAILGGQALLESWVLSLNLTRVQFMMLSQAIIFLLGWPLEWTEIIVIFVPIFLPMLKHFDIDPVLWGVLVFVNLQAAFLSPPVAMSAFYLKGVAPKHVTLNQIFSGMMPYMLIVILCMVLMYVWPGMTLWLPNYLYGT